MTTHGASVVSCLRAQAHCLAGRRFGSRKPVTCPCSWLVGKQLPLRGDVMVCLGLLMLSTHRHPPSAGVMSNALLTINVQYSSP